MACQKLALVLAVLVAGASAQGISTLTSDPAMMMGPAAMPPGMAMSPGTGAPPPAGVCSGDQVLTTPPAFSDFMTNSTTDAPMIFNGDCPAGSYVTGFIIIPAIAATGPADNRVYSIQAQCNDAEMTLTSQVNLTAPAAGKTCSANFTAGPVNSKVNFTSNSNPPAFWNVYYRFDSYLDGLLGVGSFSGAASNPGVFGCPNNRRVVGYTGYRNCQGFTSLQMKCSVCDESNLFAYPWNNTRAGDQGNASLPQPTLQCTAGQNYVDAASNPSANATLLNMTTATQGLVAYQSSIAPKPKPTMMAGTPAPAPSTAMVPIMQETYFTCPGLTYVTSWGVTAFTTTAGVRVSNITGMCSDLSTTASVHVPDACPAGSYKPTVTVKSDSNPPAWWNIFIKTDGTTLDSFLNQGASLSVGSPYVTGCPNNTYVQGLTAIAGCGGIMSLQLTCSPCNSALVGLGGPNSPDGGKYNNARTQALNSYKTYGLDTDASPDNRNTGNNLSPTVKDGTSLTLLVSYPTTGPSPNMYPTLLAKYRDAFVSGIKTVINSTDPTATVSYKGVRLNGATGRRLLLADTQDVLIDTNIQTKAGASVSQLLTSTQGQAGLVAFITQAVAPDTLAVSSPVVSEASTTAASPTTQACTGKYHFGKWCHTSIRRGGIIAIIVIGSLILVALLAAAVFGLLAMASRRRRTTSRQPAGATPWNDPAGGNANVAAAPRT